MPKRKRPSIDEMIKGLPLSKTTRTIITCLGYVKPLEMAKRLKMTTHPHVKNVMESMGIDYIEYLKDPTKYRERILSFLPEDKRIRYEELDREQEEITRAAIADINKVVEQYSHLIEVCDEMTQLQSDASVNVHLESKKLPTSNSHDYT